MNQTRLLWRRVYQGSYVKTIVLQLQQPAPGFNTESNPDMFASMKTFKPYFTAIISLQQKEKKKQEITIFVPRATISLCELCKQSKFYHFLF